VLCCQQVATFCKVSTQAATSYALRSAQQQTQRNTQHTKTMQLHTQEQVARIVKARNSNAAAAQLLLGSKKAMHAITQALTAVELALAYARLQTRAQCGKRIVRGVYLQNAIGALRNAQSVGQQLLAQQLRGRQLRAAQAVLDNYVNFCGNVIG
jgi:hypothetical protein